MLTIVLLPGLDGTGRLFEPLIQALAGRVAVQVLRYPDDPQLGYDELCHLVRAALPRDRPYVLLGESFSGPIAVSLAAERPTNLRGLVLCCSFVANPRPDWAWTKMLAARLPFHLLPTAPLLWLLLGGTRSDRLWRVVGRVVRAIPSSVIRSRLLQVLSVNVTAALRKVRVPVLYLQAAADLLVPAHVGEQVCGLLPHAQLLRLAGPHGLLQAQPKAAAEAVLAFVDGLATSASRRHRSPTPRDSA